MTEPEKKESFDQKINGWKERYLKAINASMTRTKARYAPPVTQDGVRLATFNDRVFASAIDTILSMIVFGPVIAVLAKMVHGGRTLQEILFTLQQQNGDLARAAASGEYLMHFALENLLTFAVMGMAVIYLWILSSSTPGKWLLRMRIVDERTYGKPTNRQFVVRYLGYIVSLVPLCLGFFWIGWDKKKQAWHDKIAGTLVIKVKHWRFRDCGADNVPSAENPPPAA